MTYSELNERMSLRELYLWLAHDTLEADDRKHSG